MGYGRTVTMSRPRNPNDLIRIEDAIKVLCRKTCHPGMFCPDIYCKEMWDEFEDVERVEVVRCKDCVRYLQTDEVWGRCTIVPYLLRKKDFCSYGLRKGGDHG